MPGISSPSVNFAATCLFNMIGMPTLIMVLVLLGGIVSFAILPRNVSPVSRIVRFCTFLVFGFHMSPCEKPSTLERTLHVAR